MATISAVRDALKSTIEAAVTNIRGHATIPGSINPPTFVVVPDGGSPTTNARGFDTHRYRIMLFAGSDSDRTAQATLDTWISSSGSSSIRSAIHATPGLGLSGTHARWDGYENYERRQWDEAVYYAADVLVIVETRGDS